MIAVALATQATARPPQDNIDANAVKITPPVPIGNPAEWFTPDDYPSEALRSSSTGIVNITLAIDETGKTTDCTVTESSRNQTLDDTTCALMMARSRFTPAHDAKGRPVASTYMKRVNWKLPGEQRELWTVDQIRLPNIVDAQVLKAVAAEHSMDAVAKRLQSLHVAFERSSGQIDTLALPEALVAQINDLPKTEPFSLRSASMTTINVITVRAPVDFNGSSAKPIPLQAPLSTKATVSFEVDPAGKASNCVVEGGAPVWMASVTGMCRVLEGAKPSFSPDPNSRSRHLVMTLQVSITSGASQASPSK